MYKYIHTCIYIYHVRTHTHIHIFTHTHTKFTYEGTQSTSETTARQRLRGQPNLTPGSSAPLPVRIMTARRPDHIHLSALVQSRSTQFIVHASSQLGHAGPWPPETRSFSCHFGGFFYKSHITISISKQLQLLRNNVQQGECLIQSLQIWV